MNIARFEAMVNQVRNTGECRLQVCKEIDKRIGELHAEIHHIKYEITKLENLRKKATSRKCSLIKPLIAPKQGLYPVAVFDLDSVIFYWCDQNDDEMIEFDEWPVDQEYVWVSDLEELGFRVEMV